MASMATVGGRSLIVDFPNEPLTGADMEWNFVNQDSGEFFRILLQAKKLYGSGKNWKTRSYRHLFHKPKSASVLQAVTLSQTAAQEAHTYPLYTFYNAGEVCGKVSRMDGTQLAGVSLSDGHIIARFVQLRFGCGEKKIKSLGFLYPWMFQLSDLFCPESIIAPRPQAFSGVERPFYLMTQTRGMLGMPTPPSPNTIRQRVKRIRETLFDGLELPKVPSVGTSIPPEVTQLLSHRRLPTGEFPSRIRAVFISRDERRWEDVRPRSR